MSHLSTRSSQRGISFLGLLFVGIVLAFVAIVGAKVLPTATEYMAIQKAARKAAAEGGSVMQVRLAFDRAAAVDYISSIKGSDLEVTKAGDKVIVSFAYDKEIEIMAPVFLLIKYRGTSNSGYR